MKSDMRKIDRREFTAASVMALLSGVAITVSGCGGGYDSPAAPSAPSGPSNGSTSSSGDRAGVITANHGHTATVTAAQVTTANAVTLNIQGSANHPHTLELSAADVQAIGNGQRVSRISSSDQAHTHTVTFN